MLALEFTHDPIYVAYTPDTLKDLCGPVETYVMIQGVTLTENSLPISYDSATRTIKVQEEDPLASALYTLDFFSKFVNYDIIYNSLSFNGEVEIR